MTKVTDSLTSDAEINNAQDKVDSSLRKGRR